MYVCMYVCMYIGLVAAREGQSIFININVTDTIIVQTSQEVFGAASSKIGSHW